MGWDERIDQSESHSLKFARVRFFNGHWSLLLFQSAWCYVSCSMLPLKSFLDYLQSRVYEWGMVKLNKGSRSCDMMFTQECRISWKPHGNNAFNSTYMKQTKLACYIPLASDFSTVSHEMIARTTIVSPLWVGSMLDFRPWFRNYRLFPGSIFLLLLKRQASPDNPKINSLSFFCLRVVRQAVERKKKWIFHVCTCMITVLHPQKISIRYPLAHKKNETYKGEVVESETQAF